MLNLIDRDVFGDNVTKFMTEAMISQNVLLKTQLYYGNWNNQMQLRPRQTEQLDDDIYVDPEHPYSRRQPINPHLYNPHEDW